MSFPPHFTPGRECSAGSLRSRGAGLIRRLFLLGAGTMLGIAGVRAAQTPLARFVFGTGAPPAGYVLVAPEAGYTTERGYGFEPGTSVRPLAPGPDGAGGCTSDQPFFFSVRLPEGNYNVTVLLGDAAGSSDTTVKAESRRLMLVGVRTEGGLFTARTFTVNVRSTYLPASGDFPAGAISLHERERGVRDWDDKLTLEFNGSRPCLCRLEIVPNPEATTVFLAGDSTVTDQPMEPWSSWGEMLPRFFRAGAAVANHAESGETLKAFLAERRLEKILSQIKSGDYLFIQFGHNDMKRNWRATYAEAFTTYKAYLKVFVAEARLRGAVPVLVTSMNRLTFDAAGQVTNSLGDYPAAMRQVAAEESVALIDLNRMSKSLYEALGPAGARKAFVDGTHHNNYGGYELARCIVEGVKAAHLGLAQQIAPDVTNFDPSRPDVLETFLVPPSPGRDPSAPRGN